MTKLNRGAFRVWDKKNKKYLENNRSVFIGMDGILFRDNNGYLLEVLTPQVCIVEYFTGFYDCNDQPVFEGDTFSHLDGTEISCVEHTDRYGFSYLYARCMMQLDNDISSRVKVSGTIHDATDK